MMLSFQVFLGLVLAAPALSALTAEDFTVKDLGKVDPLFDEFQGDMYAGLISVTEDIEDDNGKLMFWLFQPEQPKVTDSLLIWFNGGPGCSSFHAGLFLEMGPITTPLQPAGSFGQQADAPRGINDYAWTKVTAVMYVEQPVGTGFSYGADPPEDEEGVSRDFYNFLQNFNKIFPEQAKKRLYLVGESYAGYYVPSMAHYIYLQNANKKSKNKQVNLQGIALGNGWADVEDQGPAVIEYAYWHGMIDSVTRDAFHQEWEHCRKRTGTEPEPFHPLTTPDECGMMENLLAAAGARQAGPNMAINTYDVTTWDTYLLLTNVTNTNTRFFNNPEVRKKLNVPDEATQEWAGCMPGAGRRRLAQRTKEKHEKDEEDQLLPGQILLKDDKPINMAPYLADLLDKASIQVLVYNGDRDLSTCAQGSEKMLNGMEWSGAKDWLDPYVYKRALWMVDNYPAGWIKTWKNLDFLVVYNSGHLVPYNVPKQALDLVERLVTDDSFVDEEIPFLFTNYKPSSALSGESKNSRFSGGGGHNFLFLLLGFLLGLAAVVAYNRIESYRGHPYEQVENVEASVSMHEQVGT